MEKEARKLIEQTEFKATVGELALASCFGAVVTSFFGTPRKKYGFHCNNSNFLVQLPH